MKTVRLINNVVCEIIPDYALPAEKWYGPAFASQCMEAPDDVEQHWTYNPETKTWMEPEPEPDPEPTTEDRVAALEAENAAIKEQLQQADDTAIELYEADQAKEAIDAAQDDALIEIYEMLGG